MSVQKHKILFLSAWYPNRNDSMFGLFVKRHARAVMLYDKVNVLYVCADQYLKDKLYETEQKNINDNYEILVYYRPFNSKYRILNQIINSYRYLRAFNIGWRILKKYSGKPDIIHVNILTRAAIPAFFIYIF